MKVCLAGEGAQGFSHYETLSTMDDVEVVSLAGGLADDAEAFAAERGETPNRSQCSATKA